MTRQIPLMRYQEVVGYATVDDADYEALATYRWGMLKGSKTCYAYRQERVKGSKNDTRSFYMHREILGLPAGGGHEVEADHLDFDGLNNTRANLRVVTRSEQNQHRRTFRNNKSGVPGVSFKRGRDGSAGSWTAQAYRDGRYIHRSSHPTKESAIEALNEALALYESKRDQVSA